MKNGHLYFAILLSFFITSCEIEKKEVLTPLSEIELIELQKLRQEVSFLERQANQIEKEADRIKEVEQTYLSSGKVKLENFKVFKSDAFDDGIERACYEGIVKNVGDELINNLNITLTFYTPSGEILDIVEKILVYANDDLLDSDPQSETSALMLAIAGRMLPLKSGKNINLLNEPVCLLKPLIGWHPDSVEYKLSNLKLRSKLGNSPTMARAKILLESLKLESKMNELAKRASAFNQED